MADNVQVTIVLIFYVFILLAVTTFWIVAIVGKSIRDYIENREEKPKRERKGLKCLAGIHKWRYVKLPYIVRTDVAPGAFYYPYSYRPHKVFSTSYYNKKVSFCIKYCLKCLKFKAEKI